MSIWKSVFKSIAATAVVGGLIKGVDTLADTYGVTAKIRIVCGQVEVAKGFFSPGARTGVQGVISDLKIASGWIEVSKDGKIAFSDEFPPAVHQRIRNIVHNA